MHRGVPARVAVVEYNAAFSCASVWAIRPRSAKGWDGTFRHGASLGALDHVATRFGYRLVYCDAAGVNAFFVRSDLVGDNFTDAGHLPAHFRVASHSAHPFGHPRSRRAVAPMTPLTVEDVRAITVKDLRVAPTRRRDILSVVVEVANGSDRWLTSPQQPHVFNLALRWITDGTDLSPDAARVPLPRPLAPGATSGIRLLVPAPADVANGTLRATVVGEGVAWREQIGGPGAFQDAHVGPALGASGAGPSSAPVENREARSPRPPVPRGPVSAVEPPRRRPDRVAPRGVSGRQDTAARCDCGRRHVDLEHRPAS